MPIVPAEALAGAYDYRLVALSVLISTLASYAALDLGGRVTASRGHIRSIWLMGGAAAMGIGIWSMHYMECLLIVFRCLSSTIGPQSYCRCWPLC
jgi:NO-binding membrane sensor protein with MHYT domain